MSKLRWGLGAALALIALLAALSVLRTYLGHRLWLGGISVLVLMAIDLVGFVSLGRARRRLYAEIAALAAEPPGGELLAERRRRLSAVHAAGGRPDLDALAAATAAIELGRAYLGKYLVAVTVLVGLVGTFAGLMETLRGVAPLLADERITTLQALAGPLAGLDVTFGASLVGILVTLALALVQGDLALAEEEALAQLEERTRHVLVPELWPKSESADERTVRELLALRGELANFVVRAAEAAGERVARIATTEVSRLVHEVRATMTDAVQGTAVRVETGLLTMASTIEDKLTPVFAAQAERLSALQAAAEKAHTQAVAAGTRAADTIAQAAAQTLDGITRSAASLEQTNQEVLRNTSGAVTQIVEVSRDSIHRLEQALSALGTAQLAASTRLVEAQSAAAAKIAATQDDTRMHADAAVQRLLDAQAVRALQLEAAQSTRMAQFEETQATRAARLEQVQTEGAARAEAALLALVAAQAQETAQLAAAHAASAQRIEESLHTRTNAQLAQSAALQQAQADSVARLEAALLALGARQEAQLSATTTALCDTVRDSVGSEGLRLGATVQALGQSAMALGQAAEALGTPLSALTPELSALAREVALLAARSESEAPATTLDELVRLGEGMERLEALLRMAQGSAFDVQKA